MATPLSLVFDLLGRDVSASKAFNDVGDAADKAGKKGEGFGSAISSGMAVAGGALLGAGIVETFKSFYDAAAESAKIGALTQAAITSTGGAAKVTADQVGDLVTAISNKTGVDDEAIQSGANLLLTFTNIKNEAGNGNDIFTQTTQIMTDMSAALGTDASGSAIQLGKALNDPVKGVTALQKVGVSFTDSQKEQIKTLVATGDTLGAQKVILSELNKEFGGAAAAASTPIDKLKVNLGNLQEQIGGYLIPIVSQFASFATDTLVPALAAGASYIKDHFAPMFDRIRDGVQGVLDLIVKGDFTGKLAGAFHISEDNPVVGFVLDARDAIVHAWDNLGSIWTNLDVSGLADKIKDAAVAAGGTLLSGIKTGLDTGNWAPLGESIIGIFRAALSRLSELAKDLYISLAALMAKVDWVGIGLEIGKQVPTLLAGLAMGILNFDLGGLLKGLADHWQEVLLAIIAVAFMPAKWIGKIGELLGRIPLVGKFLEWGLNGIKGLTDNIMGWVGDVIGGFVRGFMGEGTKIGRAIGGIFEDVKTKLYVWGDDVIKWFGDLPGKFVKIAEDLGSELRRKFDEIMARVGGIIRDGVDNVINFFRPVTDRLASIAQTAWDWVVGKFNGLKDGVVGIFTTIRDKIGEIWDGIQDKVKDPIRVVFTWVNEHMVAPINSLLGKFPGGLQIPTLPALATGGLLQGPGTGTSDSILGVNDHGIPTARVSHGEFVVNAAATAKNLELLKAINSGLPGFAGGGPLGWVSGAASAVGNAAGAAFDWTKDKVGDAIDWTKEIAEKGARKVAEMVVNPLRDTAKGLIPAGNAITDVVRGFVDKLADGVLGKSDEADKAQAAMTAAPANGFGAEQWRGVVLQVLSMLGQSPTLANGVLSLISSESGGNPNAINNWDSNARAGHPSQGLMQTIPSTFAAYAGPFAGRGITDPLANIYAGVSYALNRYGAGMLASGGRHVGSAYIGYETGTSYVPKTGLAMLHEGEAVLTRGENAARGKGGPMQVTLQLAGDSVTDLLEGRIVTVLTGATSRGAFNG